MGYVYSDLQARVNRRVIDLPVSVQAEVPGLVNTAIIKLQERHNFRVMEQEVTVYTQALTHNVLTSVGGSAFSISPWQSSASNPSTMYLFKEWRGEPWFIRYTDGSPRFMTWAPSHESLWGAFTESGAQALDIAFPQALLELSSSDDNNTRLVSVYPMADGQSDYPDGEYRITIPYYRYLIPLANPGDNNWITNQESGAAFIVRWATAEAFALNWDFEKEQILKKDAMEHYQDVVKADKTFRLSSVREWVPHWKGVHSNKTRF